LGIRVGYPNSAQSAQARHDVVRRQRSLRQERISRHQRFWYYALRIDQVRVVPIAGVLAPDPRQIRANALGTPLERMVVHTLRRQREMPVALHLVSQGADLLAVADV